MKLFRDIKRLLTAVLTAVLSMLLPVGVSGGEVGEPADLQISLVTVGPGRDVYQLEGHSALRMKREGAYDLAVNWGVFDFSSPNFVGRFVKGETDYMVAAYPFEIFMREYSGTGRSVTEQQLNLTPEEAERTERLIWQNLQPENRTYRYNYVKDNCATRPLAILEEATGEIVEPDSAWVAEVSGGETRSFRSEMRRYHRGYPWYQFGIDLALGSGIDYPLTVRERGFAPVFLHEMMAHSHRRNGEPWVNAQAEIIVGNPGGATDGPTPWCRTPMAVALCLLLVSIALTVRDVRRMKVTRWFDSVLYGVYFLAGCLIAYLVVISVHEATSPNWQLLWLNPLCVIPAVGIWIKKMGSVVYYYQICNFALIILLLAGAHYWGQQLNGAVYVLAVCDLLRSGNYIWVWMRKNKRK